MVLAVPVHAHLREESRSARSRAITTAAANRARSAAAATAPSTPVAQEGQARSAAATTAPSVPAALDPSTQAADHLALIDLTRDLDLAVIVSVATAVDLTPERDPDLATEDSEDPDHAAESLGRTTAKEAELPSLAQRALRAEATSPSLRTLRSSARLTLTSLAPSH